MINSTEIKNTIDLINQDPQYFKALPEEYRNNKMIVMSVVKKNGLALEYASKGLRGDKEVVLNAVKQSRLYEFGGASKELRKDRKFVLEVLKEGVNALKYVSEELKNNRNFVLEIVKQKGDFLKYVSEELKNDKEIVLESIKQNVDSLKYASDKLKNNRNFVLEAIKQNRLVLMYASKEMRKYFEENPDVNVVEELIARDKKEKNQSISSISQNNDNISIESPKSIIKNIVDKFRSVVNIDTPKP